MQHFIATASIERKKSKSFFHSYGVFTRSGVSVRSLESVVTHRVRLDMLDRILVHRVVNGLFSFPITYFTEIIEILVHFMVVGGKLTIDF